jgi:tetratricopeptide (TPR) repeat protein
MLDDKNYDNYFLKYFFLLNTEGSDKAKEVLNSALKIDTKETDYYNVGKIYYYMGDFEKADTNLNKALKEEDYDANYFLGEIAHQNKEYEKAINYYKAYLDKNPVTKSGAVYNQLGVSYLETGDYKKALTAFIDGIKLEDADTMKTLKFNEIVAYERLIQFDKALNKIGEYLEQYPDDEKAKKELEFIKTRVQ